MTLGNVMNAQADASDRVEQDRLAARWTQAERLARLGWAEWNLVTGEVLWTPLMFEIVGRDPAEGPPRLDELAGLVVAEDLAIVQGHIRTLVDLHEPVDGEFRIRRVDGIRYVDVMHEPVLDADGETVAVRTLARDVTMRHTNADALAATRERMQRVRRKAAEDHRVARKLRAAVLPLRQGPISLPGLHGAVRYRASADSDEASGRVGGDWWQAQEMPDGRVLIAIGDAVGHGLSAAALMTQMRAGLGGLAYTGADAGTLARWLNELVYHSVPSDADDGDPLTGTAILGRFDPAERTLRWTRAGHPAPVLVRHGVARYLEAPIGPLLGAVAAAEYPATTTRLEPGDLIVLYTDGIIDRRDADAEAMYAALLTAAATASDPEDCIAAILEAVDAASAQDDICVMALEVERAGSSRTVGETAI
jgi:serine phosphatase RsbU (regulator of sigma subunit)